MATTTATLAPVAPLADVEPMLTLADAIATVDASTGTDKRARGVLASLVLTEYVRIATKYARPVGGVRVLPSNHKGEVSAQLWLLATGNTKPVPAKERTAGETSLGQYLSRYGKVAADMANGLDALGSPEEANEAYKVITSTDGDAATHAANVAFVAWLSGQSPEVQKAFKVVKRALATDGATSHVTAAIRDLKTA